MLLVLSPPQYNSNNILFSEKTKNNILNEGDFYRLYYSDKEFTSNGLFITLTLKNVRIDKYFSKIKCTFDKSSNRKTISFIKSLESNILEKIRIPGRTPIYRIDEQLSQNFIKIFTDKQESGNMDQVNILLKISGIWSDSEYCGITFRFFFC